MILCVCRDGGLSVQSVAGRVRSAGVSSPRARICESNGQAGPPVFASPCALKLEPTWFDDAFSDSQFTLRPSHYPPVKAEANQIGNSPQNYKKFKKILAQTEIPGLQ